MTAAADSALYAMSKFARLARDPDVTPRDVVKLVAQATTDGKVKPSVAVQLVSSMPDDDRRLHEWVQALYGANMMAAIRLKAQLLQRGLPLPGAAKRAAR